MIITNMCMKTELNELYVAIKDVGTIEAQIMRLCEKYHNRHGDGYEQQRALFRSYCHDTLQFFDECFECSMLGMIRCKERVRMVMTKDIIDINSASMSIVDLLIEIKSIVSTMIPIKDLPSCKSLTQLSAGDIISKAKDLIKSDTVKYGIAALLFGSNIKDVVGIEDVKGYYFRALNELNNEIREKGGSVSPIEQYLLDKFNAEIGYCNMALLKAGIGVTEELKEMVELGKKHIERYEAQQPNNQNIIPIRLK